MCRIVCSFKYILLHTFVPVVFVFNQSFLFLVILIIIVFSTILIIEILIHCNVRFDLKREELTTKIYYIHERKKKHRMGFLKSTGHRQLLRK